MREERREILKRRWEELNRELEELRAGKVQPGNVDLAARENALHAELDEIEHELGEDYLITTRRLLENPAEGLRKELEKHGPDGGLGEALDRAEREMNERDKGSEP